MFSQSYLSPMQCYVSAPLSSRYLKGAAVMALAAVVLPDPPIPHIPMIQIWLDWFSVNSITAWTRDSNPTGNLVIGNNLISNFVEMSSTICCTSSASFLG
ncbi:hypothetical protein L195_g057269 [Trifolium pratense]|uniref:Uncharacterized protein n=1 Tax=Trifolium pratense TaxID=57577 RepID=A0A2K3KVL1_TRIPR|nr:hypothetical protein L195_g057269 [Trifolium pratense]